MRVTRRVFIGGSVAAMVTACSGDSGDRATPTTTRTVEGADDRGVGPLDPPPTDITSDPFRLGVASGDPTDTSVILWTRLVADPSEPGGGVPSSDVEVLWEVATDTALSDLVATGVVTAPLALGHAVHVDVTDLEPDATYHYRFRVGEFVSDVGRTRTMPADVAASEMIFVVASCQDYEDGFWAAHRHLADEEPDLVVFLGDYIYEGAGDGVGEGKVRAHVGPEPRTVEEYRLRYALYKAEPELRAAHAAAPWTVTWDDHEVANNHAGDLSDGDEAPDAFRARRAAAYQAWYEHQPVRLMPPDGSTYPIHRSVVAGDLFAVHLLDGRQHRSDQPCDVDGDLGETCPAVDDESRTMLGADQERWLDDALRESTVVWDVVGNQTILSPAEVELGPLTVANLDQWDGYRAARRRMFASLAHAENPVVVTGDIHASAVADLTSDPDDPSSPLLGTELVGTSISSSFPRELLSIFEAAAAANPTTRYVNAEQRGYVRCTVTRDRLVADYRLLDDATDPDSPIETAASFRIAAGTPGVQRL